MIPFQTMSITDFVNTTFPCDCGKEHRMDMDRIMVSEGAIQDIPDLMAQYGYVKAYLIADENTWKAAGQTVETCILESGRTCQRFIFHGESVVPDEQAMGSLLMDIPVDCDVVIAIGSGTLNDMGRFLSYKLGLDYFIVATAPSVDGFASGVAALITDNLKTTYPAHVPKAFIGDLSVLSQAPMETIVAGVGDIIGKYTSLCDWKMSAIINGEYYCPVLVDLVEEAVKRVCESKAGLQSREPEAIRSLTEALLLSGIAMGYAGNSRPASGSEHHMSHFWEMDFLFRGKKAVLHGIKVGIGTVVSCKLYEYLRSLSLEEIKGRQMEREPFNRQRWEKEMRRVYQSVADGIIRLEVEAEKNEESKRAVRIKSIQDHWTQIQNEAKRLPGTAQIEALLASMGGPIRPGQVGLSRETVYDSILYAKEVRNRYTILQLLWDIGLLEDAAGKIVDDLYS